MENWSKQSSKLNESTFTNFINTVKVVALEKSLLVIHKIVRLFVNTLTVADKHYLLNRDNLTEPVEIQLSQKQRIFLNFCWYF